MWFLFFFLNYNDVFIVSVPALEKLVLHACIRRLHSLCRLPSKNQTSLVLLQLLLLCRVLTLEKSCNHCTHAHSMGLGE